MNFKDIYNTRLSLGVRALKLFYFYIALLFLVPCSAISQRDTVLFAGIQGKELSSLILEKFKPKKVLNYTEARELMYREIYNENGIVTCQYSGYSLPVSTVEPNPIFKLMRLNPLKGIITEHSYPKSKGANNGNAKSDMHHLFPVRMGVNIARRNFPFGELGQSNTDSWFYKNEKLKHTPIINEELYAKSGEKIFEPQESFKGNVARAVFYFFTIYNSEAISQDPYFFEEQRDVLLRWHKSDPVDSIEWSRTFLISKYQSGKPNPFVLDQSLAERIYNIE